MSCVGICTLIFESLPYCKKTCVIRLLTLVICNGQKYLETCKSFTITLHMPRSGDYTVCAHVLSSEVLKSVVQFSPLRRRSPLQCVLTLQHQVDILIFHLGTAFPSILLLYDLLPLHTAFPSHNSSYQKDRSGNYIDDLKLSNPKLTLFAFNQ